MRRILSILSVLFLTTFLASNAMAQSCDGYCGTETDSGCWCDDACEYLGDCCPDYRDFCTPSPNQACCFSNGSCQDYNASTCSYAGGIAQGLDTTCATADCGATEACCFPDGSCQDLTAGDCAGGGGTAAGEGSTCATIVCLGTGSDCCISNGTPGCDDSDCQATVCALDPFCCDVFWDDICAGEAIDFCAVCGETEACCFDDGSCRDLSPTACSDDGGTAQGSGTNCETNPCHYIPTVTHWGLTASAAVIGLIGFLRVRKRRNG